MPEEPESMENLLYFTNRSSDKESIKAWVHKTSCPKCGRGLMGKPVEKGKIKIRSNEYVCSSCGYSENKEEHEAKLHLDIKYTCPYCGKEGDANTEYKKKNFDGVPSYVFSCGYCGKKIGISKKMKKKKSDE